MDINQIKARLAFITPGTWMSPPRTSVLGRGVTAAPMGMIIAMGVSSDADAEFIAHAPKDIADLIDRVFDLEHQLELINEYVGINPYLDLLANHPLRKQWDGGGKR